MCQRYPFLCFIFNHVRHLNFCSNCINSRISSNIIETGNIYVVIVERAAILTSQRAGSTLFSSCSTTFGFSFSFIVFVSSYHLNCLSLLTQLINNFKNQNFIIIFFLFDLNFKNGINRRGRSNEHEC